jgi:uroporphyrinogen III methyltransferase / synthase
MSGPLDGKRILVTRPSGQEKNLIELLKSNGAEVHHWPGISIEPPTDWSPFDTAVRDLSRFQWAVFTSVNGVQACLNRMSELGVRASSLDDLHLATIGPATANALHRLVQSQIVVPSQNDTKGFVSELKTKLSGKQVILFRAEQSRTQLRDALSVFVDLTDVIVYRQKEASSNEEAQSLISRGKFDVLTFTSANIAKSILRLLPQDAMDQIRRGRIFIVVNSNPTAVVVRDFNLPVAVVAKGSTDQQMLEAVIKCVKASL